MTPRDGAGWTAVIPVKLLAQAKSRLTSATEPGELAFAFFRDTLEAVAAAHSVSEVVVATADPRVRASAQAAGCTVVDDSDHPGINAAASWAARHRAGAGGVAVIVSDLPCLTPGTLDAVLHAAAEHPTAFLTDADGTGTAMWFTSIGGSVESRFGAKSRAAHVAQGDADLVALNPDHGDDWAAARRDVDTVAALGVATGLGIGRHSSAVIIDVVPLSALVTVVDRQAAEVVVVDEQGRVTRLAWAIAARHGFVDLHRGQRLVVGDDGTGGPTVRLP